MANLPNQPFTTQLNATLMYVHAGSVRDMGALLLGRLLTRPDMDPALHEFLTWSGEALATTDDLRAPFLVPGVLQALCFIFKLGQRARLLPHTPRVWGQLMRVRAAGEAAAEKAAAAGGVGGVLARKLGVKLGQRLGLTFLEPRLAPWRYVRSDAGDDLDVRLGAAALAGPNSDASAAPTIAPCTTAPSSAGMGAAGAGADEDGEEEYELVEEVEEVVGLLLGALRDKDTVVRWSGAKGVGRVTGCLPKELGDEVVGSVMELFKPTGEVVGDGWALQARALYVYWLHGFVQLSLTWVRHASHRCINHFIDDCDG